MQWEAYRCIEGDFSQIHVSPSVLITPNSVVTYIEEHLRNSICFIFHGLILLGEEFPICWNETSQKHSHVLLGKGHLILKSPLRKNISSTKSVFITVPDTSTVISKTQSYRSACYKANGRS